MDIIKHIKEACQLTQSAMNDANNGDWKSAERTISKRDLILHDHLPDDCSHLTENIQIELRINLEKLAQLNNMFFQYSSKERNKILGQKSDLIKSKKALDKYLDHASE